MESYERFRALRFDTPDTEQKAREMLHALMLERDCYRRQSLQLAEELAHLRSGHTVANRVPLLAPRDHIHFDIETLGTGPTSIILSIGAVRIDFKAGKIIDQFYTAVDAEDCEFMGLIKDEDMVRWWQKQPKEVREAAFAGGTPLKKALLAFTKFVEQCKGDVEVSCCGTDFDTVIVPSAFRVIGLPVPWKFWNVIDLRTLRNWVPHKFNISRPRNAHNALIDAQWQAANLIAIWQTLAGIEVTVETEEL